VIDLKFQYRSFSLTKIAARNVTYDLDQMGNRTSVVDTGTTKNYTPNNLNWYSAVTGNTIVNDMQHQHELDQYGSVSYTYRNDEQLIGAVSGSNTYNLWYDALGRCVKRTVNGVDKYYIYDGERPILEYNYAGALVARNVYGKGIDEILMRTDYTFPSETLDPGVTFYYQQDHEGSVTHLTDVNGAVIERYRYDVFGAPTIYPPPAASPTPTPRQASAYSNRFLFTGREYAASFGFYEYRARAYHPGLGRFTSEDPKLFDAGDYNLFRYCHNDPIDFTDPMGLESPAWAQAAIPGVYEWDNVVANVQSGNYGMAAGWFATMIAQQYVGVVTVGRSTQAQASFRAARVAMAERQALISVTSARTESRKGSELTIDTPRL